MMSRPMVIFSLSFLLLTAAEHGDGVHLEKRLYRADPLPVGATDPAVFDLEPVVIQARKMSKLLKRQDVVSTCRFILFKEMKNFYDAKDSCDNIIWPFTHRGVGIASIHSEEQNTEIRHLLQIAYGMKRVSAPYKRDNWSWIGLTKRINSEVKLTKNQRGVYNSSEWFWSDGNIPASAYSFSRWARRMPDQHYSRKYDEWESWVMVNKRGHWDDTYASEKAPYTCNYCGKYVVIAEHVSWTHAAKICKSYHLQFAIVDSEQDNIEMGWAANLTFGSSVNPRRWAQENWLWLGTLEVMDTNGVGTGEWVHELDERPLGWSPPWDKKRQPDNRMNKKHGEQSVVAFSRINYKWDDSFKNHKRPFACMCPSRACHYAGDINRSG